MSINLMPSQKNLYEKMIRKEKYLRRKNKILLGNPQIGKTELVRHISERENNYKYINFVKEYLGQFISNRRLGNLMFDDYQKFMRDTFEDENNKGKKIIIDEIDALITILTSNDNNKLLTLYRQLLDMDLPIEFIFVSSIFDENIGQTLNEHYKERVYILKFNKIDKEYIIKHHFNNINLFDLEQITNMRQFISI